MSTKVSSPLPQETPSTHGDSRRERPPLLTLTVFSSKRRELMLLESSKLDQPHLERPRLSVEPREVPRAPESQDPTLLVLLRSFLNSPQGTRNLLPRNQLPESCPRLQ